MADDFVGRDRELAVLRDCLAAAERRTRVVVLAREAGTGKSRLAVELAGAPPLWHWREVASALAEHGAAADRVVALLRGSAAASSFEERMRQFGA